MEIKEYIQNDQAVVSAAEKLRALREAGSGLRWGETRRFAGRRAGNLLDKIERAEASWSRAYDRAEVRFNRLMQVAAPSAGVRNDVRS